jgi:hypothetical protein
MGASIGIIICYSLYVGKVMNLLAFVLYNRCIFLLWITSGLILAYHWYETNEYPYNVIQYVALHFYFFLPLTFVSFK